MKKIFVSAACALLLSTSIAAAQSSMGKGGAATTGETADQGKANANGMSKEGMNSGAMSKDKMGTSGMSNGNMNRGAETKDGDGSMAKGGMKK